MPGKTMRTSHKLIFMNIVIALGVVVIVWVQWPEAMNPPRIGAGYEQGTGARIYLAILVTGMLALLYAVVVYLLLSHWLFRPDELKAYRARRLVESIRTTEGTSKNAPPSAQSGKHDFID
jgi:hypothetical protein